MSTTHSRNDGFTGVAREELSRRPIAAASPSSPGIFPNFGLMGATCD